MPEKNSNNRGFLKYGILTIVAVYILILVGGIVRSTGSGMGCPDWPKCFGNYVPPTSIAQLPENYQEIYAGKRLEKNRRLSVLLQKLGFNDLSERIIKDPFMYIEAEFNPVKTWIEYINRLVGVTVGLLIIGVVYYSFSYFKSDSIIFWLSLLSLVLVIFEGWLGSIVVSTNLLPGTVTVHMGLALVIVMLLIYTIARSQRNSLASHLNMKNAGSVSWLLIILLIATFVQILIGTQVREHIDAVAASMSGNRGEWINELGMIFPVHRSFSIGILALHLFYMYRVYSSSDRKGLLYNISVALIAILVLEIFSGVILNYAGFPAFAQPVHLLLANILVGIQFLLYILVKYSNVKFQNA